MTSKLIRHEACPSCRAKGEDREGNNLGIYDDGHTYCFKEGAIISPSNSSKAFEDLSDTAFTYEYIAHRGLSKDTLRFYDIKTKVDGEGKPVSVGFKYPDGSVKVRDLEKKSFAWTKEGKYGHDTSRTGVFGRDKFSAGAAKAVTITEGEYDAASLHQVLRAGPVVSVQNAATAKRDCSVDYDWLNAFERIYLAFDNDQAGRDAARAVARLFDYNKLYVVKFTKRKDANDYLQADESDELRNLWHNARPYLPESVISSFQEFEEILKEVPKSSVPYPFKTLNDMTYGNRTGETVLITAQEGIGKTEVMHAFEYSFLKGTNDNVAAIFLEEPKRRHLQALAGLELQAPVHLPDSLCSEAEILAALQKVVQVDERLHIYSHFGSNDPDVLLDTIRFLVSARACRRVLLDHITMAVSGLAGEDERRALDYLSTRLEMMVKELDFALLLVSHVNDFGQTRGSRNIAKVADIRIDLKRDLVAEDPAERNLTYMTVSKNRFSGKTGPAGVLKFDPKKYMLEEYFETPANDNERDFRLIQGVA